ncbi:MAG: response regulator, partial [Calditrichia bacterium]
LPPAQEIPERIQKMELKKTSPGAQREKKIVKDRRPNILIVDDSLSIRKYLSGILSEKGYLTDTSRNGAEALELLKSKEFDIMITDLEMPQVSGYELIESVRQEEQFDTLPIIVLTGRAGENFKNLTAELGADSYIIKPFKDRELFEEIDKFVSYDRV